MFKECLTMLINENIHTSVNKYLPQYLNLDDEQLSYLLSSYEGLKINNLRLHYYNNIGFRARNIDENVKGRDFVCNRIEKILNDTYKKGFNVE